MTGDHRSLAAAGNPPDVIAAFEAMPAVLWAFAGPDHRVIAANAAARASIGDRPDIIGRPIREVIPEMAGQQVFEMIDEVYRTGSPISHADRRVLVDRDGSGDLDEGYFTYTFLPTSHDDGTVSGMVVHIVETTSWVRQRQAEQSRADESERRLEEARDVVLALQRSLLPAGLPVLPRLRLAARYVIAGSDAAAGGDWFDAIPVDSGRVALVVGDVVGHGPEAAAAMGQLRAVTMQALASGVAIAEASARMDSLATQVPAAVMATACLVLVDSRAGELEYCSRGHPPPLVIDATGDVTVLTGARSGPVGTPTASPSVERLRLTAGQMLLLYSDGLIERPDKAFDESLSELVTVAGAVVRERPGAHTSVPHLPSERLCALLVERFAWSGFRDDVTVLVAELSAPPAGLSVTAPATPECLAVVRRDLQAWLDSYCAGSADEQALQQAVGEACINVIEHAYRDQAAGTVSITGDIDEVGVARVRIVDHGTWRPPPVDPGNRGRGLMLMRAFADNVTIDNGDHGTTVTIELHVHRPTLVGTSRDATGVAAPVLDSDATGVEFDAEIHHGDEPVVRLQGPIDIATVERARHAIMDARRSTRTQPTIDLSEVTYLSSVGVRLLHEITDHDEGRTPVLAPNGSPAHQILSLTGIRHLVA